MTVRTFEMDDLVPLERQGSGVRASHQTMQTYDLTVVAADVAGVVDAAGGWLCDRVRAGWRVTVRVPAAAATGPAARALTILGVQAESMEAGVDALGGQPPAALAFDANAFRADGRLRRDVLRAVDEACAEVTVWGGSALFASDRRFRRVRHDLSAAARAFKALALLELSGGRAASAPVAEEFVSAALWYPTDGSDLVTVEP
jgi:hypothetical protein